MGTNGQNGTPQNQAKNSKAGRGGVVPPAAHQFKPGVSGNPGGRPKGRSLLGAIAELMDLGDGKARKEAAKAFVTALKRGSFNHAKELIEREEGRVPEDGEVRVVIVYTDARDSADPETSARRAAACN